LAGSVLAGRKGQVLLLVAGVMALLSMTIFGAGLLMSNYVDMSNEPAAVMGFFPTDAFQITADTAMQSSYHTEWLLSYGFWLTIGAAIMAFVAAVVPSLSKKQPAVSEAKNA
jgi:hypothetical protein